MHVTRDGARVLLIHMQRGVQYEKRVFIIWIIYSSLMNIFVDISLKSGCILYYILVFVIESATVYLDRFKGSIG
jgi:hypothetical protein